MKTLKKDGEYLRVGDSTSVEKSRLNGLIKSGWSYCPKSEWKTEVRGEVKTTKKKKEKKK